MASRIPTSHVLERVIGLFSQYPNLIEGFNTFLPPAYSIQLPPNVETLDLNNDEFTVTTPFGDVKVGPEVRKRGLGMTIKGLESKMYFERRAAADRAERARQEAEKPFDYTMPQHIPSHSHHHHHHHHHRPASSSGNKSVKPPIPRPSSAASLPHYDGMYTLYLLLPC